MRSKKPILMKNLLSVLIRGKKEKKRKKKGFPSLFYLSSQHRQEEKYQYLTLPLAIVCVVFLFIHPQGAYRVIAMPQVTFIITGTSLLLIFFPSSFKTSLLVLRKLP